MWRGTEEDLTQGKQGWGPVDEVEEGDGPHEEGDGPHEEGDRKGVHKGRPFRLEPHFQ